MEKDKLDLRSEKGLEEICRLAADKDLREQKIEHIYVLSSD